jgi:hypothetical protein
MGRQLTAVGWRLLVINPAKAKYSLALSRYVLAGIGKRDMVSKLW